MDQEEESVAYLRFLNDAPQNYFLQSTEDGLNGTIPVEPIFTEIASTEWSSETFPILLNTSLITEETKTDETQLDTEQTLEEDSILSIEDDNDLMTFIPGEEKNSVLISSNIYLQLKSDKHDESNGISLSYTQSEEKEALEVPKTTINSNNSLLLNQQKSHYKLIQLVNADGTLMSANKQQKENSAENQEKSIEYYFEEVKANKCKICSFLCEDVKEMEKHIRRKHLSLFSTESGESEKDKTKNNNTCTMYLCSECKSIYSDKDELKKHMISAHNLTVIQSANNVDTSQTELNSNHHRVKDLAHSILIMQQKAMKKVKCTIKGCPLRFAKDELRIKHEECHLSGEKRRFMCPECNEKFSLWRLCNMHLWKVHSMDIGLITCPMCSKFKSNSMGSVANHMLIHTNERPYVCQSCGKTFKQYTQLRNHAVLHRTSDIPNWALSKQCEFCERKFADSKCLKKHIKFVHDKFKPFICNICGHETARKAMLQLHYRQHTGDKPHKCSYCEYRTGDHNCLRKHIMRHIGVAKYSCPHCKYQSIQSSAYKTHLANKHPGKEGTFACTICSYTTVNATSYYSHVKCHELEKNGKLTKSDKKQVINSKNNQLILSNQVDIEDDEIQNCLLDYNLSEEAVDTGGITIPAGCEVQSSAA